MYDYFPSDHHGINPPEQHIHNLETGEKVGVETGKIYDPKGKTVCGKISKKALKQLRRELMLKGVEVLGAAVVAYDVYNSVSADEAQSFEDILDTIGKFPPNKRQMMLQEIISNNPDKFKEVKERR